MRLYFRFSLYNFAASRRNVYLIRKPRGKVHFNFNKILYFILLYSYFIQVIFVYMCLTQNCTDLEKFEREIFKLTTFHELPFN